MIVSPICYFFFQAEDGIRDYKVTGVQTCALPILNHQNQNTSTASTPLVFAAFVGLDWGDEKHALSLGAAGSTTIERTFLEQTPEALADWANALRTRFPNGKIAVCLEQARGALLSAL